MLSNLVERIKAQLAVKTAEEMGFKSEKAKQRFEIAKENNPDAVFVENWARLMQKNMTNDKITDSLLWNTYNMMNACSKAGVDLHYARVLLATYWKFGDQLIAKNRSA